MLLYESRKTPIVPAQVTSDSQDVARASAVLSTLGNTMEQLVQRLERLESKLSTTEPPRSVSTTPRGPYTGKAHVRCFGCGKFGHCRRECRNPSAVRHGIPLTADVRPARLTPRRIPQALHSQVEDQVQSMLDNDIIQPSASPWSAPIVLVKKSDGAFRFCVDYRRLNAVTVKDCYPLPRIDETLDSLSGATFFSSLDLASGYWQVEMEPEDRAKTAFSTSRGLYEFKVMPFGLCNAPGTFQRLWNRF